jgi:hypothetical protein
MKHYKSKRGYFYKMVGDKKTRISIEEYKSMKGGKLKENGILDKENFFPKNIPSRHVRKNNESLIELQPLNNVNNNIDFSNIPEPKIMRQKGFRKEPYIFFGYNPSTGKYRYVFYNDLRWFSNTVVSVNEITFEKQVICKKLYKNNIIELTNNQIMNDIPLKILSHLFIFLVNKRKKNENFMERLFDYLRYVIYIKITIEDGYSNRIINPNIDFNFLGTYYNQNNFKKHFIKTSE